MGRGSIAVALAALCMLSIADGAGAAPCRLPRLATAQFATDTNGALLVPVSVGDKTVYFDLNETPNSFVYKDDADRLDFGRHHRVVDDGFFVDGKEVVRRRTTDFTIGHVRWRAFEFIPLDDKPAGTIASGSLGLDFLENDKLDIELNAAAGEINFIEAGVCATPPWAHSAGMALLENGTIPTTLDGKLLYARLNFKLPVSLMDFVAFDARFSQTPPAKGPQPDRAAFDHAFARLTIGEAALIDPVLHVQQTRNFASEAAFQTRVRALHPYEHVDPVKVRPPTDTITLGRAELKRLRFYFMYHTRQLFVTPVEPGAVAVQQEPDADSIQSK